VDAFAEGINYNGRLVKGSDPFDGAIEITAELCDDADRSSPGITCYEQNFPVVNVVQGEFSLLIGNVSSQTLIDVVTSPRVFLFITLNENGVSTLLDGSLEITRRPGTINRAFRTERFIRSIPQAAGDTTETVTSQEGFEFCYLVGMQAGDFNDAALGQCTITRLQDGRFQRASGLASLNVTPGGEL
ncbi:MAG: hypothetical protein AAFX94_26160, partial [Myxococcota bacterium]